MLPKNIRNKPIPPEIPKPPLPDPRKIKGSGIKQAIFFTVATGFYIWAWKTGVMGKEKPWGDWLAIGAIYLFGSIGIVLWVSYFKGWSAYHEDKVAIKTLQWMIFGPIGLIILGILIYFVGGWLFSIPGWAAVIIILLVFILLKRK